MVNDMLEKSVIQESRPSWNSPLFLVSKIDGAFRQIIDFRLLNKATPDKHYPLPVLRNLLMSLGRGNSILSSHDLLTGYWQVEFEPASWEITAFITASGH